MQWCVSFQGIAWFHAFVFDFRLPCSGFCGKKYRKLKNVRHFQVFFGSLWGTLLSPWVCLQATFIFMLYVYEMSWQKRWLLGLSSTCNYVDMSLTWEKPCWCWHKKYLTTCVDMCIPINGTLNIWENNEIMSNFSRDMTIVMIIQAIFYTTVAMHAVLPGL